MRLTAEETRGPGPASSGIVVAQDRGAGMHWPPVGAGLTVSDATGRAGADWMAFQTAVIRLSRSFRQDTAISDEITSSQLLALATLAEHGEMTLGELASIERVAPPSMTRTAVCLEKKGLIGRRQDADDQRMVRVAITQCGRELLRRATEERVALTGPSYALLSARERDLLTASLPLLQRLSLRAPSG
jgi:DNA-binding MarR family transcriptional regulator